MYRLDFAPLFDLPLVAIVLAAFVLHFNRWVVEFQESTIDLPSRLPKARRRVILFFGAVVLICWMLNIAVWAVFAFLLAMGIVVVAFAEGDGGLTLFLLGPAYLIREWAFDFPQLVLHPGSTNFSASAQLEESGKLVGMTGTTTSPLRPIGDAEIDGQKHSVVALDGTWIEAGSTVVVKSYRNGLPAVALVVDQ